MMGSDVRMRGLCISVFVVGVACAGCVRDGIWRKAYARADGNDTPATNESAPRQHADTDDPPAFVISGVTLPPVDDGAESGQAQDGHESAMAQASDDPGPLDNRARLTTGMFSIGEAGTAAFGITNATQASFAMQGSDFDPDISPDGTHIVYASTQHAVSPNIYTKSVTGRAITQVTSAPTSEVMPAWSPDGRRIAYASNRNGNWDIYVISAGGGNPVQITSDASHELHPSWSPDGERLVYCRLGVVSGRWELWVTKAGNTGVRHFIGYGLFPEWCPKAGTGADGADKIVFQRSRRRGDHAFAVWTIDYKDGQPSSPTEIASSPIVACINPTWSPDGQWIVYATMTSGESAAEHGATPSSGLWLASLNGHGRVNLTVGPTHDLMPVWGAQNDVFYVSDRSGVENIWKVDASSAILAATGQPLDGGTALTGVDDSASHIAH